MKIVPAKVDVLGGVAVLVGLYFLYGRHGNAQNALSQGSSAIGWMVGRWNWEGADMSHGWLIPPISLFVVWCRRKALLAAPRRTTWLGLALVVMALAVHVVGYRAQLTRLSLLSLIGLLWSLPLFLYGGAVARLLVFPCAYLLFCIPMSFLDALTVPLRLAMTQITTALLNGLGIGAVRVGTAVHMLSSGGFSFDVADPCSGLRSLLAMTALMAVYANLTQPTLWRQWFLFAMSVPIAMAGNVARILTIALVAEFIGQDTALKLYHDFSGFIVFGVGILLMIGVGRALQVNYREQWKRWRSKLSHT